MPFRGVEVGVPNHLHLNNLRMVRSLIEGLIRDCYVGFVERGDQAKAISRKNVC